MMSELASVWYFVHSASELEGDRVALILDPLDDEPLTFTCRAIAERSTARAYTMWSRGVRPGHRVVLCLPTGIDFVDTLYGTLRLGAAAVPLYPPWGSNGESAFIASVERVVTEVGPEAIVTTPALMPLCAKALGDTPCRIISNEEVAGPISTGDLPMPPSADDLALIQLSSGSTGLPRPIALSHANITTNVLAFKDRLRISPDDIVASWLPLYHDMGLIGSVIGSAVTGIPLVLSTPQDFVRAPLSWLRTLSRHRVTIAVAPQFAYNLLVRRRLPSQDLDLDLRSVRVMLNGAEQVDPKACDEFERRFHPVGLRSGAIVPCYGLAEHTLAVTMGEPGSGRVVASVCAVGPPMKGTELAIEAADSTGVGEILVRSESVALGAIEHGLVIPLADAEGWLHTGDLGRIKDGHLFVHGRRKDVVVVGGRNLYPEQLEQAILRARGRTRDRTCVIGCRDADAGTESVVVIAESRRQGEALGEETHTIREAIWSNFRIALRDVAYVRPGTIPVTTSGKPRRSTLRHLYESGELALSRPVPSATRVEAAVGDV
jgi:acyl-CoA synthetase (AMP-forming)/AMP-acid ligase II